VVPSVSKRGKAHVHLLVVALDEDDVEKQIRDYCARAKVVRGACDFSPVRGWARLRTKGDGSKLRTNLYRICSYMLDEKRQGHVVISKASATGHFADAWSSVAASLSPLYPAGAGHKCERPDCDAMIFSKRATCSDACRRWVWWSHKKQASPKVVRSESAPVVSAGGIEIEFTES